MRTIRATGRAFLCVGGVNMTKVLLVEDDALIAGTVMYYLEKTET